MSLSLQNSVPQQSALLQSPTVKDGIPEHVEIRFRFLGGQLIGQAGILLRLPQTAIATAQILYQRFYYTASFKDYPVKDIVLGSIFLACKVEECTRKLRDIGTVLEVLDYESATKAPSSRDMQVRTILNHGKSPFLYLFSFEQGFQDDKDSAIRAEYENKSCGPISASNDCVRLYIPDSSHFEAQAAVNSAMVGII
ncbi:hypothetical protein HDU76_013207 [Blyttiomyces sp. JEL0837]|nr:hypothetical protein HDU76_013207 [Blyttiomyces sp. JEL0837]